MTCARLLVLLVSAAALAACSSQTVPTPSHVPGPAPGGIVVLKALRYSDGIGPTGALTWSNGAFWGTTTNGSHAEWGTVFKLVPNGSSWKWNKVKGFGNKTGFLPAGNLTYFPAAGLLYGTTLSSFAHSNTGPGTIFSVNPKSGKVKVVYAFKGGADGFQSTGNLTLFPAGGGKALLYGTASAGGPGGYGTIFSFNPSSGKFAVLHAFAGGADGAQPAGALAIVGNTLYGTTYYGGSGGAGTIYSYTPATNAERVLYSFTNGSSGTVPIGGVTAVTAGGQSVLFGSTSASGANGGGTFYAYNLNGTFGVLHQFGATSSDGTYSLSAPYALCGTGSSSLTNCLLYGNTARGGANGDGTLFQISPLGDSTYVTLASFDGANGAQPVGSLTLYKNALYGTAYGHGTGQFITNSTIFSYALPVIGANR